MYQFLVWHVLIVATSCELFAQESGYVLDYAPKYVNYKPRDYHFNYAVSDPHTGDHKSQWEVKENGVVRGGYSLLEPDGTTRIVEYIADHDGFRAIVKKLGTAVHPEPVVPIVPEVAHYSAYDGQINNYGTPGAAPVLYQLQQSLGQETLLSQPQAVASIESVPHPVRTIEAVPQPVVPIGHSYSYEQNFGTIGGGLAQTQEIRPVLTSEVQGHNVGTLTAVPLAQEQGVGRIEADLSGIEAIPLIQGQERIEGLPITEAQWRDLNAELTRLETPLQGPNIGRVEEVPVLQGQSPRTIEDGLGRIEAVPVQGHGLDRIGGNIGRLEALSILQGQEIPVIQGQRLGPVEANLGRIEAVPVQGHGLDRIDGDVGRFDALSILQGQEVPVIQGQRLGPIETNLGKIEAGLEGHKLGRFVGDVGRLEALARLRLQDVSALQGQRLQGHNLGTIESVPGQGHEIRRVETVPLPQPQIEIHAARPLPEQYDNAVGQGPVPGSVPIGPSGSYSTTIEFHGLTGNPEDDSRYTQDRKDVYHASYSQKVTKMVPAPGKRQKLTKKEFLIYYPDSESH